jgi:hypothetical protein
MTGMSIRPGLEPVLRALLARPSDAVSLDEIGEAIGTVAVSMADIEALFSALEAHGKRIAEPPAAAVSASLHVVLRAARDHVRETGETPAPADIARRAGLPLDEVRRALLFASVVQR